MKKYIWGPLLCGALFFGIGSNVARDANSSVRGFKYEKEELEQELRQEKRQLGVEHDIPLVLTLRNLIEIETLDTFSATKEKPLLCNAVLHVPDLDPKNEKLLTIQIFLYKEQQLIISEHWSDAQDAKFYIRDRADGVKVTATKQHFFVHGTKNGIRESGYPETQNLDELKKASTNQCLGPIEASPTEESNGDDHRTTPE